MEPITIRIQKDTKKSLEETADEYDVSVSEHVRDLIQKGTEYDELNDRLDAREERIETLEEQLTRRSQIEEKIEELPDRMRASRMTWGEKRDRAMNQGSTWQRMKWMVTGVPDERIEEVGEDR